MVKLSNSLETFGSYIRKLRIKNDIGQRQLAKKIGVAASYLNDMEKNKRTAPRTELIKKLSVKLNADLNTSTQAKSIPATNGIEPNNPV